MDLMEALARASSEHVAHDEPRLNDVQKEAQIMELRAFYERIRQGCPFKPGDLVTPMKGRNVKFSGHPHIVTEVPAPDDRPPRFIAAEPMETAESSFGRMMDMRVACIHPRDLAIIQHWAESVNFVPWADTDA